MIVRACVCVGVMHSVCVSLPETAALAAGLVPLTERDRSLEVVEHSLHSRQALRLRGGQVCDGLSVAGINVWTGCWGGSCRAKRCGRVCAETACRSTSGLAPSRAVTCVTCRVPISQSQGSARRDRGLRASCCALVCRAVRCIRTFTSLYYGAGAQNKLLYG